MSLQLVTDETSNAMPHNPDSNCVRCCQINELTLQTVAELRAVLDQLKPENLTNIPGPFGMILKGLFK